MELENKIFKKFLRLFLTELMEKGEIGSQAEFIRKHKVSYAQTYRHKKWLKDNNYLYGEKKGTQEILKLTDKGKKLIKAYRKFITEIQTINNGKKQKQK